MTWSPKARKNLRLLLQAVVSATLIGVLFSNGIHEAVATAWHNIGAAQLALACGFFLLASVLSARRWQLLLRCHGIAEGLPRLFEYYNIGLFFSLFLPSSAGGDAYRVFAVARRGRPAATVLLATLQERLLGLGATMLVGFAAALWYRDQLPAGLVASVLTLFAAGVVAVTAVLYLGGVLRVARRGLGNRPLPAWGPVRRLANVLRPLREAPPLRPWQMLRVLGLALATFAAAVAMYAVVCEALGAGCGWLQLSLVVAVVAMARMLPISVNGIGVGEGAFVTMMALFNVPAANTRPAAVVLLGVTILMSLLGGALLLARAALGKGAAAAVAPDEGPVVLRLPEQSRGDAVHAA